MLIGVSAAAQVAKADVSVDFFYNNLSGGNWIEVGDYGYCWQPGVAVSNSNWRPYADGYWAYTDVGWTWVSYEDFGWATYHYGRWARLEGQGWVWVPGRNEDMEWGPAWVSWRTGDQYVGWAPLPPTIEPIYQGRAITGQVDIEFDIGPAYYNFVDVRYIGEPVLRERIFAPSQNITYINQTINVTNITYNNSIVYNHGPDINVMNQRASRPIQRLTIQRDTNADFAAMAKSGGLKTKVQGQSLMVAAPAHITKASREIAPPNVKTKVAKANVDRGWAGVGDAKAQEDFKQKLKKQDRSTLSKGANTGVNAGAQTGTTPAASPAASAAVDANAGVGKGDKHDKNRAGESVQQNAGAAVGTSPAGVSTDANAGLERGRGGKHGNPPGGQNAAGAVGVSPAATASAPAGGSAADVNAQERGKHNGRRAEQLRNAPNGAEATSPATSAQGTEPSSQGEGKHNRRNQVAPGTESQPQVQPNAGAPVDQSRGQGERRARRLEQQAATPPTSAAPSDVQGQGGRHHDQGVSGQPVPPNAGEAPKGQGKKEKVEASPVPSPQ